MHRVSISSAICWCYILQSYPISPSPFKSRVINTLLLQQVLLFSIKGICLYICLKTSTVEKKYRKIWGCVHQVSLGSCLVWSSPMLMGMMCYSSKNNIEQMYYRAFSVPCTSLRKAKDLAVFTFLKESGYWILKGEEYSKLCNNIDMQICPETSACSINVSTE